MKKPLSECAKEAAGIVFTILCLWLFGAVLSDGINGIAEMATPIGLLAAVVTCAVLYALIFLWTVWFYRPRR